MIENPNIKGPSVYAKKQNDSTPCYIPFSKDSGDNPVIATEQYVNSVVAKSGNVVTASTVYRTGSDIAIEPRGYRDLNVTLAEARVGDFVVISVPSVDANYKQFNIIGMVNTDGKVTARLQNITDERAVFPRIPINMKWIKF